MKLMSVLQEVIICVEIEFQRDAPVKEKLVLKRERKRERESVCV